MSRTQRLATITLFLIAKGMSGPSFGVSQDVIRNAVEFENLRSDEAPGTTLDLPMPTGPYSVGTLTYYWVDPERRDEYGPHPDGPHQVIAQLWYPADGANQVRPAYMPGLNQFRAGLLSLGGERPLEDAERLAALEHVNLSATLGPPLAASSDRFPIVLFSPGGNMSRHWHSTLLQELASHGYIVAAMSHKYSTWDVFPSGGFAVSRDWNLSEREGDEKLANYLARDARHVLDRLAELNIDDDHGRFTGRLDTDNVAVIGHSRGGTTVARTCMTDDRAKICVVFDNIGPDAEQETGLKKPQLTIRSDHTRDWSEDRVNGLRAFLARNNSSAWEVVIAGANHFSFSDLPITDAEAYESEIDPLLAHELISELTLGYLNTHLLGAPKPGWMIGRAPPHPAVAVKRLAGE